MDLVEAGAGQDRALSAGMMRVAPCARLNRPVSVSVRLSTLTP
ncbi:Unknown protein sequence [Pseudomonas syringae pv. syringae]|uniref:Uncharacterized protein n=1 Tax=Pseudomonas syringae pv. solidagae TaxID=264458 RepID=A0A3M5LKZ3_PSESX|nr:Unknown protein sequence [Pseudomonas syringae pv. syringae]RMT41390.1 hypothetical protein ALP49_102556 [Pseudomonas syringae pv. solidagae]RMT47366.1 hypothetical protein ALP48_102492 [Pseudomonas syringae pv. solidagae]